MSLYLVPHLQRLVAMVAKFLCVKEKSNFILYYFCIAFIIIISFLIIFYFIINQGKQH